SSVAKLGWLIDHGLPAPDRWLGVPELVLHLLTGAEATEHSLAARTGAYHVTEGRFLPDVISHVTACTGASAELFPPVRAAGTAMGFVSEDAAAMSGIPAGVPVTIAGHDHLAAAAGLGARPDDLLNSVGTAETLVRRVDSVPDVDRALELELAVTVWPGGVAWGVLASATRSGLVLEALAARLGIDSVTLDLLGGGGPGRGPGRRGRRRVVALSRGRAGPGARRGSRSGGDNGAAMTSDAAPQPVEPELSPEVAERTSGLRTGWTTGTCASAAAKAATVGLCTGVRPDTVEVGLPGRERVTFPVEAGPSGEPFEALVVKDAGDDPDCTDGARMTATVEFGPETTAGPELRAGDGVGTITLPGLGLPVGAPAINPVPRAMILAALAEV